MESGGWNTNPEIKQCFVQVQKLDIDEQIQKLGIDEQAQKLDTDGQVQDIDMDDSDSDSSLMNLPDLPYLLSSRSKPKSQKSTAELLKEHQNLAKDIKVDSVSSNNIEEALRRLDTASEQEIEDCASESSTQFSQEIKDMKIFFVNDSLQFFNNRDVTLSQCGYENRCIDSFPVHEYEEKVLAIGRAELEHVVSSFLFSSHAHCISDCKSFITYLLRNMCIYEDLACIIASFNTLSLFLNKHPDAKNLSFSSAEIFMLLFNYGTNIDSFEFLKKWPDVKKSLEEPKWPSKSYCRMPSEWSVNLKMILKAVMDLVSTCKFKPKDLCRMIVFLLWMTLDSVILQENLYSTVRECIYVCLNHVQQEKWDKIVCDIVKTLVSMEFSSVQEKWNNIYHMTESVPNRCPRGIHLRRHISFSALKCLCSKDDDKDEDENYSEFNLQELHHILQQLVETDSDQLLSYATKFVDMCIRNLNATKEDYKELCSVLKQCEGSVNEKAHEAKTHFIKIHAKLKIYSGKNIHKISAHKSLPLKIKEEIDDDLSTFSYDKVKMEPLYEYETNENEQSDGNSFQAHNSENENEDTSFKSPDSEDSQGSGRLLSNEEDGSPVNLSYKSVHIKSEYVSEAEQCPVSLENKSVKILLKRKKRSSRSCSGNSSGGTNSNYEVEEEESKQSSEFECELVPQVQIKKEMINDSAVDPVVFESGCLINDFPVEYPVNELDLSSAEQISKECPGSVSSETIMMDFSADALSSEQYESVLPAICNVKSISIEIMNSEEQSVNTTSGLISQSIDASVKNVMNESLLSQLSVTKANPEISLTESFSDISKSNHPNLPNTEEIVLSGSVPSETSMMDYSPDALSSKQYESVLPAISYVNSISPEIMNSEEQSANTTSGLVSQSIDASVKNVMNESLLSQLAITKANPEISLDENFSDISKSNHSNIPNTDEIVFVRERVSPRNITHSPNEEMHLEGPEDLAKDADIAVIKEIASPTKQISDLSPSQKSEFNKNTKTLDDDDIIFATNSDIFIGEKPSQKNERSFPKAIEHCLGKWEDLPNDTDVAVIKEIVSPSKQILNLSPSPKSNFINKPECTKICNDAKITVPQSVAKIDTSLLLDLKSNDSKKNELSTNKISVASKIHIDNSYAAAYNSGNDSRSISPVSEESFNSHCNEALNSVLNSVESVVDSNVSTKNIEYDSLNILKDQHKIRKSSSNQEKSSEEHQSSPQGINKLQLQENSAIGVKNDLINLVKNKIKIPVQYKRRLHGRKQSSPLKKEHKTEILMSLMDKKSDKANVIDRDVFSTLKDLVESSVSEQETGMCLTSRIDKSQHFGNSVSVNTNPEVLGSAVQSDIKNNLENNDTIYSQIMKNPSDLILSNSSQNKTDSPSLINIEMGRFPKFNEKSCTDVGGTKSFQNKSELTIEKLPKNIDVIKSFQNKSELTIEKLPKNIDVIKSFQNKSELTIEKLPKNIDVIKSFQNKSELSIEKLPRKVAGGKSLKKRKNTEFVGPVSKIKKNDSVSDFSRNENKNIIPSRDNLKSPLKYSPTKSVLGTQYANNKSPKNPYFNYFFIRHKYSGVKKTKNISILNETGLNLGNILRQNMSQPIISEEVVCESDSDDSDIVQLYTDPKRYADKECLVVYESEDVVILSD